jgi:hypothetical protein
MRTSSIIVFTSLALVQGSLGYNYLEELPLKILNVRSLASRYPASNSQYRTNVENGQVKHSKICLFNASFKYIQKSNLEG